LSAQHGTAGPNGDSILSGKLFQRRKDERGKMERGELSKGSRRKKKRSTVKNLAMGGVN